MLLILCRIVFFVKLHLGSRLVWLVYDPIGWPLANMGQMTAYGLDKVEV